MLAACLSLVLSAPADVTTAASRKQNLLEYVAGRDDVPRSEREKWDEAIRTTFGGKALKDGTDEGVTAAKSVIAGAIFFDVEPAKGAAAAYDAYHDTYRWVPPPIAVNYQLLVFQGKQPKASTRELAFDFPRWFNSDLAPDLVAWWDEMLASNQITGDDARRVREALKATKERMRPLLLDQLWRGAELEARKGTSPEIDKALNDLAAELDHSYRGVAHDPKAESGPYYARYAALAKELGVKARPAPPGTPRSEVTLKPRPPPKEKPGTGSLGFAEVGPKDPPRPPGLLQAPLPGDPLFTVPADYAKALVKNVDTWIGTPYLWGGNNRRGVDCSGFTRGVYQETFGIDLPRNARAQALMGQPVSQDELKPGDLIFFDTLDRGQITHVGMYVGDGNIAHASSHFGVTRAQLAKQYYQHAFRGSRRILKT